MADTLDFVLQRTRVFPADLATVLGEVFSSVYPQMIRDGLLAMDSKGYLTVHSSLAKTKSAKEQLKDLTRQDPIASFFLTESAVTTSASPTPMKGHITSTSIATHGITR